MELTRTSSPMRTGGARSATGRRSPCPQTGTGAKRLGKHGVMEIIGKVEAAAGIFALGTPSAAATIWPVFWYREEYE